MSAFHESRFNTLLFNRDPYADTSSEAQKRAQQILKTMQKRATHIRADRTNTFLRHPRGGAKTVKG